MKKNVAVALLLFVSGTAIAAEHVRGHYRKDGTYVEPHYRSSPNNSQFDNYSYKGNTNPYTGERGTQEYQYRQPSFSNQYDNNYNRRNR